MVIIVVYGGYYCCSGVYFPHRVCSSLDTQTHTFYKPNDLQQLQDRLEQVTRRFSVASRHVLRQLSRQTRSIRLMPGRTLGERSPLPFTPGVYFPR